MDAQEQTPATGFIAFGSGNAALTETIEAAAGKIRSSQVADVITWQALRVAGRLLVSTICEEIGKRQFFVADLTLLNSNVLLELGFAIARGKRIWLTLDQSLPKARTDFERFQLLATVGYRGYSNSDDILRHFFEDSPQASLHKTIYRDLFDVARSLPPKLLYVKSEVETDASIRMSRRVQKARFSVLVDDPSEMRLQNLSWYARNASSAIGVVAHLLSSEQMHAAFHNAKASLIAGIAFGFGKPLLMLAHQPFTSPLDYQDLLKTHSTAAECETLTSEWITQLEQTVAERSTKVRDYQEHLKAQTELQQVALGEPVAELEADKIPEYFVTTATYNETLRSRHSIVVGRKGTGKTAMLYKLLHELRNDPRNHVCVVKPVAYELEGILRLLGQTMAKSEQGYVIESLWKLLIYTELAKSVYEALREQPSFVPLDDDQTAFLQFVDSNSSLILPDFSVRLESAVNRLQSINQLNLGDSQRVKISELLHADLLPRVRAVLGKVLRAKRSVTILVDNLDKAWDSRSDLSTLSQLLFGLLGVSGRIAQEFETARVWRDPVNLSLILFLRSDIYVEVIAFAQERDKLPVRFITWDQPSLLLRVVEERFARWGGEINRPDEIWARYFCQSVKGMPTRDFLLAAVLPRPRDLIYLVRSALDQAVNSSHAGIEEQDVLSAVELYSRYALDSLIVEGAARVERLEDLLYEFAGADEITDADQIRRAVEATGMPSGQAQTVTETLVDCAFLGIEVQPDRFEFLINDNERAKFKAMARRVTEGSSGGKPRYLIARPFHAYLEIGSRVQASPEHARVHPT